MNRKTSDVNGLCIPIFVNNMGWHFSVIVQLHDYECLIYIFTGKVENDTPIIFNKKILVTKRKHGIDPNDIIRFNKELEFLSKWIIELVNIDECLHKNQL